MTQRWPINHLTADDLDAFHSASLSVESQEHLEECAECRALALADRALLEALERLPVFEPSPAFADRVMARIQVPSLRMRRIWLPAAPMRLALAATVAVALGASIIWSLFNRELLLSWLQLSAAETGRTVWLGVRVVATNLTTQPWYASLRDFVSSPERLAAAGAGALLSYGASVFALRRLLTPPSRPVSHANW